MLNIDQVTKRFGQLTAIDNLNLTIPKGMIFGLLGPNGAGKTTLLRMIMGLVPPSSGSITIFGRYKPNHREVKKRIGYMPQQLAVYPGLTVLENVRFFGRLYNIPEKELKPEADRLIELVELTPKRGTLVAKLSGGMVRRVMLATALIHQPSLVILDEPTAGVDPALRIRFWNWFRQLVDSGTSILITTHHISEASQSEAVVFLRQGSVIDQGSPAELMQRYDAGDLEQAFVRAVPGGSRRKEGRA